MQTTYHASVLLLVRVPSPAEVGKLASGLGFSDGMCLLETYAFLQQILSGLWVIDEPQLATKKILEPDYTTAGQAFWINLASITPLEVGCLRVHYQYVENNNPNVSLGRPVATFKLEEYPNDRLFKTFEIGAMLKNGRPVVTYNFAR